MLSADQITALQDSAQVLVEPVVEWLISDIAERIAAAGQFTSTAQYEIWRAQNLGLSLEGIKKQLRKKLNVTSGELERLLRQVAEVGYNYDLSRLPTTNAIPFEKNTSLQQIVDAAVKMVGEEMTNLTQTAGFVCPDGIPRTLSDAYRNACDYAFKKTVTGAQGYISAIRDATRGLAEKGIVTIDYRSGNRYTVEAAVRRSVVGGLGLIVEEVNRQNFEVLGCDGWEISAHVASAPDHIVIQGKQYLDEEYRRLNNSLVRRIGTLNCGHDAFGIILGVNAPQYTPEELEQMRQENEKGVTYGGKHYTLYEATQVQRKLERSIRRQKRRILVDEALRDTDKLQTDQIRYQMLTQEYKRFSKAAGLRTQYERMEVAGFTGKHGKAAESAAKTVQQISTKEVEIPANHDTMKANTANSAITSSMAESAAQNSGVADLHHVTRLDIEKYKCVSEDIITDEVIITDERIQHIKERHPKDYERFSTYIPEAIEKPDYIMEDKPATALVLKHIEESGEHFRLAIRLATSSDNPEYKNSVLTFLKIREKEWRRLIRNKKILYKAE